MGRRSIYTTAEEKRKVQFRRDELLKLNREQYALKKRKVRERQQNKRELKKLQKNAGSSVHLATATAQEISLERLDNVGHEVRRITRAVVDEATETYAPLNENMSEGSLRGFSNGYQGGMKFLLA